MFARRPLRALQVEPTSRCTRRCAVCPRSELADRWQSGDLSSDTWARLAPDLRLARHVHLQGWGEPLLHPELREMVRDAKAARCTVGFTTNGDLLDDHAVWIVEESVDLLAVSVAGAGSDHARLRDGSDLEALWRSLATLGRLRRRRRPRLQVAYLLTVDTAEGLHEVVRSAATAGADELYVTHLDVAPSVGLARRAAFDANGLRPGVAAALDRASAAARATGLAFRGPARRPEELLACALDPTRFAFVTWSGAVAPCVNLALPVDGPIPRVTGGRLVEVEPVVWGQLGDRPLSEILDGDEARRFQEPFRARLAAERHLAAAQSGWGPSTLRCLERSARECDRALEENPFPAACRGCPKADGW
ncbi:MAG TPA: radical SAM protein [Methylomirabilota bacterium]|nr:radical SAM protein [Methylomirabilota bacterium]